MAHLSSSLSLALSLSLFSLFTFSPSIFSLPATHHHSLLCSVPHVIALPFLPLPGSFLLSLPHFHPSLPPSLSSLSLIPLSLPLSSLSLPPSLSSLSPL